MPPSVVIDNHSLTTWEDLQGGQKRSSITFGDANAVVFASGNADASIRLTNVALPSALSDAVNKQYVDAAIMGLSFKQPVRAVALTKLDSLDLANQVVDGVVTLAPGDRVLLTAQMPGVNNGVYLVAAAGQIAARTSDLLEGMGAAGVYVFVNEGQVSRNRAFVCTNDRGTDLVGTDVLEFIQFNARPEAMAGRGLIVGEAEQLDVQVDESTLTILSDTVQVRDAGIVNVKIADSTIENVKLVHPQLEVATARGLLGGSVVDLGGSMTVRPDFTVVPDLDAPNTFTKDQQLSSTTASTSQSSGALVVNGGVGIGGDLFVTSTYNMSDRTLKTNLQPLSGALEVVCRLTGYEFEWTDHPANRRANRVGLGTVGVVAQEVVEAGAKRCVINTQEPSAAGEAGAAHSDGLLAVDYCKLVPYLIQACKEMADMCGSLKRRCEDLERDVASCKRPRH